MSTHQSLLLVVRFTSDATAERLGDAWSVRFAPWMALLVLFETAATFIRLMPFLDLAFVPLGSLLPL